MFRKMHNVTLSPIKLPSPCSCHSSCSNVPFPTAVVEYSIQTNQAELTTLWLDEECGSVRRIPWHPDPKVWIMGLNFGSRDCGQLACQLMRRSYLLCDSEVIRRTSFMYVSFSICLLAFGEETVLEKGMSGLHSPTCLVLGSGLAFVRVDHSLWRPLGTIKVCNICGR